MNIPQLENFLTVARRLNFRKASEEIYIAQPALSRQIKLLEEEIGAELFDRTKKQITLTPAGVYFMHEVSNLLKQLRQTIKTTSSVAEGTAGEIRIAHSSSAMHSVLPELLRHSAEVNPDLKTTLIEGSNQFIFDSILRNEADFGFVPNAIVPDGLSSHLIYEENYILILPSNHRLNKRNFKTLKDCKNENWILHPQVEGSGYMETIMNIITSNGFYPKIVHRTPNTSSVLRLVEAGLGIALMGKSTVKGFDLKIKYIELTTIKHKLNMKMIWKSSRQRELDPHLKFVNETLRL